jgi:hypothetical protein
MRKAKNNIIDLEFLLRHTAFEKRIVVNLELFSKEAEIWLMMNTVPVVQWFSNLAHLD